MVTEIKNPLEAYRQYLQELHTERETIKTEIHSRTERLREINEILDGEKKLTTELKSLTTATRKRRASKAPVEHDSEGNPIQKKRGRKAKGETPNVSEQ